MAKKKSFNYLGYIPVVTLAVGMVAGFVRFQAQAEQTKVKVDEVAKEVKETAEENDKKIEEVREDNQEVEKGLTEMRVQQMYMQKSVDMVNESLKELLKEIKEDKKKK